MAKKNVWVISGTHWDREWRFSSDESYLRLMELMDELLTTLETDERFTCFLLDGGTVVLEDYLRFRPENRDRIKELFKARRLSTVQWYTLPEMNTLIGESLVRNLLVGSRMADEFHGTMRSGYTATSYGQISQLPQMYRGFNMDSVFTYRGLNKHALPPLSTWKGADGSEVALVRIFDESTRANWFTFMHYGIVLGKLPRDTRADYDPKKPNTHMADERLYVCQFQSLSPGEKFSRDPEEVANGIASFMRITEPHNIEGNLLGLDMEDNASPYPELPDLIEMLNDSQEDYDFRIAHLDDYTDAIKKATSGQDLFVWEGELRHTAIEWNANNGLMGDNHSSRIRLKVLNADAEAELIAAAEPMNVFSALLGGQYYRTLLDDAWLNLLKNHAHDSICGAAVEPAHQDMLNRFRSVTMIAGETSRKAAENIWKNIDTASAFGERDVTVTIFNTQPSRRREVVSLVVDVPDTAFEPVRLEPYNGEKVWMEGWDYYLTFDYFDLVDEKGNTVPFHQLEQEDIRMEIESRLDSNAAHMPVKRKRLLVEADVPGMGYRTYALRPRKKNFIKHPEPDPNGYRLLANERGVLENAHVRVEIQTNGTFHLTDKARGVTLKDQHYFIDMGSTGICHVRNAPLRNYTVTSLGCNARLTLIENNPLRATWKVALTLPIPAAADNANRNRLEQTIDLEITSFLTLRKDSPSVEIKTHFDNRAWDHELKACFPTDVQTDTVSVETPFDVVARNFLWGDHGDNKEKQYTNQAMLRFVDVSDGKRGIAFLNRGLREYEMMPDPERTMRLTLMRSHRQRMRANMLPKMTPEEMRAEQGQYSVGEHTLEYAIMPHAGDWRTGGVLTETIKWTTPWRAISADVAPGELAPTASLFDITPDENIHLAALTQSGDGQAFIMRLWNSADEAVEARIATTLPVQAVSRIRMDERESLGALKQSADGKWALTLGPKAIETLKIEPRNPKG